ALARAEQVIDTSGPITDTDLTVYLLARAAIAHGKIRELDLTRGHHPVIGSLASPASASQSGHAPEPRQPEQERRPRRVRWKPWSEWTPNSRMALQAMIAATIASGVGEAISASRWYWAVLTAFIIFIGATTRSSILTRAFRRVI